MTDDPIESWRQFAARANASGGLPPAPISEVVTPTPFSVGFHSPQIDPLDGLPERAQERLRKLRQRADDLHALIPEHADVQQASVERIVAENRLRELQAHAQDHGHGLSPDHPSVAQARKVLDRATREFELIKQRSEDRAAAWQATSGAASNVEAWLKTGRPGGTTLEDFDGPEPTLAKGENGLLDAIESRRRRCRELKADLHRIRSAPYPSAHCNAQMRQQIEQLAERGAPSVSRLVELDGPVDFQTQSLTSEVHAERRSLAFTETADALALVAWLHRDALIAALDREIATEADDKAALSHEARQKAEAETMGDLLDIERQEAALVRQAQAQGLPIEHRGDCSPVAVLQVQLVTASRADASPPTTAGHSWPLRR